MSLLVLHLIRLSSISIILAKSLIWVVQPDANVDYCASLTCGQVLYELLGAQPFNYTDAVDSLPNAIHAFGGRIATTGDGTTVSSQNAFIDGSGLFEDAGADDITSLNPMGVQLHQIWVPQNDWIHCLRCWYICSY